MVVGLNKPLRNCSSSELSNHSEDASVRASLQRRRISMGLLEEADRLSQKTTASSACKQAGISVATLKHFQLTKRLAAGSVRKPYYCKYTRAQKLKCLAMMEELFRIGFSKSRRKCWIEAGKRVGVNGRSIEFQYVRGIFKP